jgi:hypothetical protein
MTIPADLHLINRREAIRRVCTLLGGAAFAGGNRLLHAVESAGAIKTANIGGFSTQDIAFLDEIADTILPETHTPGAKSAHVGAFMARMVTDCYSPDEQAIFRDGMRALDAATQRASKLSFLQATPAQRLAVLSIMDREQKRLTDARDAAERRKKGLAPIRFDETVAKAQVDPNLPREQIESMPVDAAEDSEDSHKQPAHYFRMMKELVLLGYFTSEIGCTQALRYAETPGRYDPCLPYTPGERAWAAHA